MARKLNLRKVGRKLDQQIADSHSTLWGCLALAVLVGGLILFFTAPYWLHAEPINTWVERYLAR